MKVQCIGLFDKETGQAVNKNNWLSVGRTYHVIFIEESHEGVCLYRIVCDDPSLKPMLFEASLFETVDSSQDNWQTEIRKNGSRRTGPPEFLPPGFWSNFFDGEPHEIQVFNSVLEKMN